MRRKQDVPEGSEEDKARTPVLFSPIHTHRAFEEVSAEIKRLIFKGELKPGDRLPSEAELANQFHVGRQTIREALRLLELSGFISVQKGGAGGPRVRETILNTISNAFLDSFQMGRISMDELTAARVEIEKIVLRNVFKNAGPSDLGGLRENVRTAREKIERGEQIFDENIHFHRLLAEASKNRVLAIVVESILAIVAHFRSLFIMDLEVPREVVSLHERLLDAVERGDQETAAAILDRHLRAVGERFKNLVDGVRPEKKRKGVG
jgi:GntR family transcriptional regulator, transcriptional repressor for pyruvate dehydrogenase complex